MVLLMNIYLSHSVGQVLDHSQQQHNLSVIKNVHLYIELKSYDISISGGLCKYILPERRCQGRRQAHYQITVK